MRCYYSLEMTVAAPTKTTTRVTLDCIGLGVRVEKSGGSVKRPLEDALAEFAHLVRPALVKEAQEARAKTPWTPAEEIHKDAGAADPAVVRGFIGKIGEAEEEPAGPLPEHGPLFVVTNPEPPLGIGLATGDDISPDQAEAMSPTNSAS